MAQSRQCGHVREAANGKFVRCTERTNHPSGLCHAHRPVQKAGA